MPTATPLLLIGAGAVGRMHIERCLRHPGVQLLGVADPGDTGRAMAEAAGLRWFADHHDALTALRPAAAIVATPNSSHVPIAMACMDRGVAVLVEKPVADQVSDAERLIAHEALTGVPVLVGHQRRHNPILRRARDLVAGGLLGRPVAATVMATWFKPASYFEPSWRRSAGAGPVLINLTHDIDMLLWLLGDVVEVQAMASSALRGFDVEDTAAATLRFSSGALGSLIVSDTAVSPWNWDLAAGEAAHYPRQTVEAHYLCGTEGALTLPGLQVWRYRGTAGWQNELTQEHTSVHSADPYAEQLSHLCEVVAGRAMPICSAADGLRTLRVTRAVLDAAETGQLVRLA